LHRFSVVRVDFLMRRVSTGHDQDRKQRDFPGFPRWPTKWQTSP
jgi:hypothetical protein